MPEPQYQQPKTPTSPNIADDQEIDLDQWDDIVADKYQVPKSLMRAIRSQESGGNVGAVSPTGVRGRYQVTKRVAESFGLDRDDPWQQSVAAAKYLRQQYEGSKDLKDDDERWLSAAAKYYGGPSAVQGGEISGASQDGVSNPGEYVKSVARKWGEMRKQEGAAATSARTARLRSQGINAIDFPEGKTYDLATGQFIEPSQASKYTPPQNPITTTQTPPSTPGRRLSPARIKAQENVLYDWAKTTNAPEEQIEEARRRLSSMSDAEFQKYSRKGGQQVPGKPFRRATLAESLQAQFEPDATVREQPAQPQPQNGPIREAISQFLRPAITGTIGIPQGIIEQIESLGNVGAAGELAMNPEYQRMSPAEQAQVNAGVRQIQRETSLAERTRPTTRAAQRTVESAIPVNPGNESWLTAKIPAAFGSTVPFFVGGAAGRLIGLPSMASAGILGSAMEVDQVAQEMEQAGVDPERRDRAILAAGAIGLTEMLGLGRALDKLGLKRPLIHRAVEILEEGGQEALQQWLENVNAAYIGAYAPGRQMSEGVAESAILGAIVGGGFQGLDVASERLARGRTAQPPVQPTTAPLTGSLGQPTTAPLTAPLGAQAAQAQAPEFDRLDQLLSNLQANTPAARKKAEIAQKAAQAEQERLNLYNEADAMASEAADRAKDFIDAGDLRGAANELISQQDALREKIGQIPKTPEGLRERDAINRQIRALGDQVKDLNQQEKEAAKPAKPAKPAEATTEEFQYPTEIGRPTQEIPTPNAPETQKTPPPSATGALRAEANEAKAVAAQFENEGRFDEAAIKYDAAHKALVRLRRAMGQPKTPEAVNTISQLDQDISAADLNRRRMRQAAAQAAKPAPRGKRAQKVAENAPTKPLPSPPPLLGSVVNPEGGVPATPPPPERRSGIFGALARQQEAEAAEAPQPRRKPTNTLSPIEYLKRKTNNEGIRVSDRGEAANLGAKEEGIVGLVNRQSKWSLSDAQVMLDEGGFRLPDGRRFNDPSVHENDVLDYLREHGKQGRQGTREMQAGIDQEMADYYANQPTSELPSGGKSERLTRATETPQAGEKSFVGDNYDGDSRATMRRLQAEGKTNEEAAAIIATEREQVNDKVNQQSQIGDVVQDIDGNYYVKIGDYKWQKVSGEGLALWHSGRTPHESNNIHKNGGLDLAGGRHVGTYDEVFPPEQRRQASEKWNADPANKRDQRFEVQFEEGSRPARPRTERLPVPRQATTENLPELRKRREELSRLEYDRTREPGGEFSSDLADELRELGAVIKEYEIRKEREAQGGRRELAPPPGGPDYRAPSSEDAQKMRETLGRVEPQITQGLKAEIAAADPDEADLIERSVAAIDQLFEDPDAVELLNRAVADPSQENDFIFGAERAYGVSEDVARSLIESRRAARERENEATRQTARKGEGEARPAELGEAGRGAETAQGVSQKTQTLLDTDPRSLEVNEVDPHLTALENLRNDQTTGAIDLPDWATRQLLARITDTNNHRKDLVRRGLLPAKHEARVIPGKRLTKEEGGRRLVEQMGGKKEEESRNETPLATFRELDREQAQRTADLDAKPKGTRIRIGDIPGAKRFRGWWEKVELAGDPFWRKDGTDTYEPSGVLAPWITSYLEEEVSPGGSVTVPAEKEPQNVTHPNPDIDGKPIIARTDDGRVVVENPENKGGVSVVKDRTGELAPAQPEEPKGRTAELEAAFERAMEKPKTEPAPKPSGRTAELEAAFEKAMAARPGEKKTEGAPRPVNKYQLVKQDKGWTWINSVRKSQWAGSPKGSHFASRRGAINAVMRSHRNLWPDQMFERPSEIAETKPTAPSEPKPRPTAKEAITRAGKETTTGLSNVAKGLRAFLDRMRKEEGGGVEADLTRFPGQDPYNEVKPYFEEAYANFRDAAKSVQEAMDLMVQTLRERFGFTDEDIRDLKKHIIRFMKEKVDEIEARAKPTAESNTYPGKLGILKLPNLPADLRAAEAETAADLEANLEDYIRKYDEQFGKRLISADEAKKLFPRFQEDPAKYSQAVHTSSSRFSIILYERRLDALPPNGTVVFLAGGPGSGKSTVIEGGLDRGADIVFDFLFAHTPSNDVHIGNALGAQAQITVVYVHNPVDRAASGMMLRARDESREGKLGRTLTEEHLANKHFDAQRALFDAAEKYQDNPNVKFLVFDNSGARGQHRPIPLESLRNKMYADRESVMRQVKAAVDQTYERELKSNNPISPEIYRAVTGRSWSGPRSGAVETGNRANAREPERPGGYPEGQQPGRRGNRRDSGAGVDNERPTTPTENRTGNREAAVGGEVPEGEGGLRAAEEAGTGAERRPAGVTGNESAARPGRIESDTGAAEPGAEQVPPRPRQEGRGQGKGKEGPPQTGELIAIAEARSEPMATGETVVQAATENLPPESIPTENVRPGPEKEPKPKTPKKYDVKPSQQIKTLTGASFTFTPDTIDAIESGGQMTKLRQNMAAIELARKILLAGRQATREEQQELALYAGFGGIKPVFYPYDYSVVSNYKEQQKWSKAGEALKELIGEEAFKDAKKSTQNAHFTSPRIVQAMWRMAEKLGYKGGRVLEPSMGSGNFLGLTPEALREKTSFTGVELDPTTGSVAQLLYPDANIKVQGFEDLQIPDNFYDMAIGNVPFGDYRISDPRYNKFSALVHNYFFLKSIDKVRPGGVLMFITSTGTMDAPESENVRKYLAERADLVGAIRLPADTFKNALTSVVTDLVILRKRLPSEKPGSDLWTKTDKVASPEGEQVQLNRYFNQNRDQMLGEFTGYNKLYPGARAGLNSTEDFEQRLDRAIDDLRENVMTDRAAALQAEFKEAGKKVKSGAYVVEDGKLYRNEQGGLVEEKADEARIQRVEGMLGIRDLLNKLTDAELGRTEDDAEQIRKQMNTAYDRFTGMRGFLSEKANVDALEGDPDLPRLLSLEDYDAKTKRAKKRPIFEKSTVVVAKANEKPKDIADAVVKSFQMRAEVNLPLIADSLGISQAEAAAELTEKGIAFQTPAGNWEIAARYLSGNVRRKLAEARVAAENDPFFEANVKALETVVPPDVPYQNISVAIGAPWIEPTDISTFVGELFNEDADDVFVHYDRPTGAYIVKTDDSSRAKISREALTTWGTPEMPFLDLLDLALAGKQAKVTETVREPGGRTRTIFLPQETQAAQTKLDAIKQRFREWVWEDEARRERLARRYNEMFSALRPSEYDASFMLDETGGAQVPGMDPNWKLRPHQMSAVLRGTIEKRGMLAHEVGLGKTLAMIATASELKRLGIASKPAIAVPKKVLPGFAEAAQAAFPLMKIHVIDGRDAMKRQRTMSQIATGDHDLVLMTHDNMDMLKMRPEFEAQILRKELDEVNAVYNAIAAENAKRGVTKNSPAGRIQKQIEKRRDKLAARIHDALKSERKDEAITFEDTGIDFLFVDEFHKYKSLPVVTALGQIKGVPTGDSQRAINMLMRARYLQQLNGGGGLIAATGTPISNTLVEAYIMSKFLQPDVMEESGVESFDAWARNFAEVVSAMEFDATGRWKPVNRLSKFKNLPELQLLSRVTLDVKTAQETGILEKRPKRRDKAVAIRMTPTQAVYMQALRERADAIKKGDVEDWEDNYLVVSNDGRMMSADVRLVMPGMEEEPTGKVAALVNEVSRINREKPGKTQMIFCDIGIHPNAWGFNLYDDITDKLVASGIPRNKIINFQKLDSDAKVEKAIDRLNEGDALIAIGHRETMGTGVNAQRLISAVHQFDATYKPALIEQSEARGWRQGNENEDIEIISYVVEGSFDAVMWATVARKQQGISSFMRGQVTEREMTEEDGEQLSYDMIAATASGDSDYLRKAELEQKVFKLDLMERAHEADRTNREQEIPRIEGKIESLERQAVRMDDRGEWAKQIQERPVEYVDIAGNVHTERADAAKAMVMDFAMVSKVIEGQKKNDKHDMETGKYKGLQMYATIFGNLAFRVPEYKTAVKDRETINVNTENYAGTIQSFDATIANMTKGESQKYIRETQIPSLQKDMANLRQIKHAPFPYKQQLETARKQLDIVTRRLEAKEAEKGEAGEPLIARSGLDVRKAGELGRKLRRGVREKEIKPAEVPGILARELPLIKESSREAQENYREYVRKKTAAYLGEVGLEEAAMRYMAKTARQAQGAYGEEYEQQQEAEREARRRRPLAQVTRFEGGEFRSKPQFVQDAERRLKAVTTGHLVGSGTRQFADIAIVTGWKVYKAGMDFAEWSGEVIKQAGEKVQPYLERAWAQIQKDYEKLSAESRQPRTRPGDDLGLRIEDEMARLQNTPTSPVTLARLRERLPDVGKQEFDRGMLALAEKGRIALHGHDFPQGLSPEERNKLVKIGDEYFSGATFREGVTPRRAGETATRADIAALPEAQRNAVTSAQLHHQVAGREFRTESRAGGDVAVISGDSEEVYDRKGKLLGQTFSEKTRRQPVRGEPTKRPAIGKRASVAGNDVSYEGYPAEFGLRKSGSKWEVFEKGTGEALASGSTKQQAIDAGKTALSNERLHVSLSSGASISAKDTLRSIFGDKVANFFTEEGGSAKMDLGAREMANYAITGATKLSKAPVRFAEWSQDMVRQFGEKIRPRLLNVWQQSMALQTTTPIEELLEGSEKLAEWRDWYDRHQKTIEDLFDDDAHLFRQLLAATSQHASVKANITFALKAYRQIKSGESFKGYMPAVVGNLERIRNNERVAGQKISEFDKAVTDDDINAMAVDMHVAEILFGTRRPSPKQVERAKFIIRTLADKLGWTRREAQSALWALNQVRQGKEPVSYEAELRRRADEIRDLRAALSGGEGRGVSPGARSRRGVEEGRGVRTEPGTRGAVRRFLAEEGGSASLGLGLGNIGRRATAPKPKVPLPADWDISRWSQKVVKELGALRGSGKITKAQAGKLTKAITDVIDATAQQDGAKLFLAREELAKLAAGKATLADIAGAPRTTLAGLDISFLFRQGGAYNYPGLLISPIESIKRVGRALVAMGEEGYGRANAEIAASPRAGEMRASGLHLANQAKVASGNKLIDREEAYIARFMQDLPGYKQTERGNTTLLDMLRAEKFDQYARFLEKRGKNFKNSPRAFKQMAKFVNLMTGRGSLGEFDSAIPFLSLGLFSPRWVISRVQLAALIPKLAYQESAGLVGRGKATHIDPQVRKLMWRDLGAYAGAMGVTLGLLAAAGAAGLAHIDVGWDPEESDFGKVIINGKHHYDLTGGMQQYLVLGYRLTHSFIKREKGEQLKDYEKPSEILLRFLRGKASPAGGLVADIFTGENYQGQPISIREALTNQIYPLIIKDFMDGWNVEGKLIGGLASIPGILGVGYTAFERGGEAVGAPELAKEARQRGVFFGAKALRGESPEMAKARAERRKSLVTQYGPALLESTEYREADEPTKTKMLKSFADRTNELANEKEPKLSEIRPGAILKSIKTAAKATETRHKHERKRLIYAPAQ